MINKPPQLQLAEAILRQKFEREPFHNLYQTYAIAPTTTDFGGTCSDKAMSYASALQHANIDAHLHCASIGGKLIHRVVRVVIEGEVYFADVGNGWPALQLYPALNAVKFDCFGMGFRSEIRQQTLVIFHRVNGIEKEQMQIETAPQSQHWITQQIEQRFCSENVYPFTGKVRFSQIVNQRFLFLRDDELYIYSSSQPTIKHLVDLEDLSQVIKAHFDVDINQILE